MKKKKSKRSQNIPGNDLPASKKFSSPRIVLISLNCLKAGLIYSNTQVTSSPEIWASASDGGAIKQSREKGS